MERTSRVELDGEIVGNDISHHGHPRMWSMRKDLHLLSQPYQGYAGLYLLHIGNWSGRQDLHLRLPSSKLGCLLLTYALFESIVVALGLASTFTPLALIFGFRRSAWLAATVA